MADTSSRVLIVDDDKNILSVLLYGLESYGYAVSTCENAACALRSAAAQTFDFILTDHDMPGMGGIELVQQIRLLQPRAVVIGMSGRDLNLPFLQAGANDFVQKPFVPYDIVMMIEGGALPD